jgi:hypothetical protein
MTKEGANDGKTLRTISKESTITNVVKSLSKRQYILLKIFSSNRYATVLAYKTIFKSSLKFI